MRFSIVRSLLTSVAICLLWLMATAPVRADIYIDSVVSPSIGTPGGVETYTVTVTNQQSQGGNEHDDIFITFPAGYLGAGPTVTAMSLNGVPIAIENPTLVGGRYRWDNAGSHYTIAPDVSLVITFTVTVAGAAPDGVYPIVIDGVDTGGIDPAVSTGPTTIVTLGSPPSLNVTKSVVPSNPGSLPANVTYTVSAQNTGASATSGVVFTDVLPKGFTFGSTVSYTINGTPAGFAAPSTTTVNGVTTVTWAGNAQIPGNNSTAVLVFTAAIPIGQGNGNYDNDVTVSANNCLTADSGPTATVTVGTGIPMSITKTCAVSNVSPGGICDYTVTLTNNSTTTGAVLSKFEDLVPPGFGYANSANTKVQLNGGPNKAVPDPTQVGRVLTWSPTQGGNWPAPPVTINPNGGTLVMTFRLRAVKDACGTFNNTITAYGENFAATSTGPTATVTVDGPQYSVSKVVTSPVSATVTVPPQQIVTYRITVTNHGTDPYLGRPIVVDTLPPGFTYAGGTSAPFNLNGGSHCTAQDVGNHAFGPVSGNNGNRNPSVSVSGSQQTLTWDVKAMYNPGDMDTSDTVTLDFDVVVPAGQAAGQYPNVVTVTDKRLTGNVPVSTGSTAVVTVNNAAPAMQISKSVSQSVVQAFQTVDYTIHVVNLASATASATGPLTVVDTLPSGFSYQPGTATINVPGPGTAITPAVSGSPQTVTFTTGLPASLAIGASFDIVMTVQVSGTPGNFTNVATLTGANFPQQTTGPTAMVTVGTAPSISITKTCSPNPQTVPGNNVTFTITITNSGSLPGTNASITDILPAGFSYQGASTFNGSPIGDPAPVGTGGTITWNGPFTIPGNSARVLTFVAKTSTTAGVYLNNASTVGSNYSTVTLSPPCQVTVGVPPNVTIAETVSPASLNVMVTAQVAHYTITVSNGAGSQAANAGALSITMPSDMQLQLGTATQQLGAGPVTALTPSGTTGTISFSQVLQDIPANTVLTIAFDVQVNTTAVPGTYYVTAADVGSNYAVSTYASGGSPAAQGLAVTSSASAVDLQQFTADAAPAGVTLAWRTGSEWENLGFNLYRAAAPDASPTRLNAGLVGQMGGQRGQSYHYVDHGIQAGQTYYYWLEDLEFGGGAVRRGPLAVTVPEAGTTRAAWQPPSPSGPAPDGRDADDGAARAPADAHDAGVAVRTPGDRLGDLMTVVGHDAQSLTLELRTPDATVAMVDTQVAVTIPGLGTVTEEGQLRLPKAVVPVAIPADAAYHLEVLNADDDRTMAAPPQLANHYIADAPPILLSAGGHVNALSPLVPDPGLKRSVAPEAAPGPVGHAPTALPPATPAAPAATVAVGPPDLARSVQFAFGVLARDPLGPGRTAVVAQDVQAGDNRLLKVVLYPVLPREDDGTLVQHRRLRVRVSWDGGDAGAPDVPNAYDKAIGTLLGRTVAPQRPAAPPATLADDTGVPEGPSFYVTVTAPGVQRLSRAALQAAGVPLTAIDHVRLFDHGHEVPLHEVRQQGQVTALDFVAATVGSRYSATSVYVLALGDRAGARMAAWDAVPADGPEAPSPQVTATAEVQQFYWANMPDDGASDQWFWDAVTPDHRLDLTVTTAAADPSADAELQVGVRGMTTETSETLNNLVQVAVNGVSVGTLRWGGKSYLLGRLPLPGGLLRDGDNAVTLTMPARPEIRIPAALLDRLAIRYARHWTGALNQVAALAGDGAQVVRMAGVGAGAAVYDVTTPATPQVAVMATSLGDDLTFAASGGHQYLIADDATAATPSLAAAPPPAGLRQAQQADYLIITPEAFRPAAERVAQHRQAGGLQSRVVSVESIWQEFAGGNPEPEAIRRFLQWTAYRWEKPRPTYVLLFGAGHFDYRNDYGSSPPNWVPPLLRANPGVGDVGDDNAFAAVMGDDPVPDLFIGRLPAQSAADADALVDKILTFEGTSPDADWHRQALAVADAADPAFSALRGQLTEAFAATRQWQRFGMADGDALRQAWNAGADLALYVGHGAIDSWGAPAVLDGEGIAALADSDRYGVVVSADCLNGYFHDPDFPSLAETMVRAQRKGAVAVIAAGGYSVPEAQAPLLRQLFRSTLTDGDDIGTALAMAKVRLFLDDAPFWQDETASWVLLGDPAIRLPVVTP